MLYDKLQVTNLGDSFYIFKISDTDFTFTDLFNHFYGKFMEKWNITADEVGRIVMNEPRLKESDFFDYTISPTPFLFKENALYSEKFVNNGIVIVRYNVYVTNSQYDSTFLNIICQHIMRDRFPSLFEAPFAFEGRKYPESVKNIEMNTLLKDIDMMDGCRLIGEELSVADLIDIIVNGNADKMEMKPNWSVYEDGLIFIKVGDEGDNSVYLNISDLYNHDWQAVLDRHVYSIKMENGEWYNGRQENAPYMASTIVSEIEKFVKEC